MNRRELVLAGVGFLGVLPASNLAGAVTPVDVEEKPWNAGTSATMNPPADAVAEPGTVQVVRVSPVLYPEFAAILIHNATDRAVMLKNVAGILSAPDFPELEHQLSAYGIPPIIIPPGEYWIGRLMTPPDLAVGTSIEFDAEVQLQTELPRLADIQTLLTAVAPEQEFELPEADEDWPIRYENSTSLPTAPLVSYQHIFFDDAGEICGFISADDKSNKQGQAQFRMELSNSPGASTGGAVLGKIGDSWLAQWSHAPAWPILATFELAD